MKNLLEATNSTLAQYLWDRRDALCTMCNVTMVEGYCHNPECKTYPVGFGRVFVERFQNAIENIHTQFKKRFSLKPLHSKVVSGGQVESKRRKH